MTTEQAEQIINKVMKAHWSNWQFAGQELKVWIEELRKFDFETTKDAINELYKSWDSNRYPKMPHIMGAIRSRSQAQRQANKRFAPLFEIIRPDGRRRWRPFVGDVNSPREEVEKRAEAMREEANRLYPKEAHIVVFLRTDEPEEILKIIPGARERAIEDILAGPDTKTRRWLEYYLKKPKKKSKKDEPVKVGEVIPF